MHLHARKPEDGRPDQSPTAFRAFVGDIKQRSDAVINITTGGSPTMTVVERMQPALQLQPEVASLNMGSMNFGLFPMLGRYKDFKQPWEQAFLEGTRDLVFKNTFADIEFMLKEGSANGTRFEFECYDTAHLYNLAHFLDRKLATTGLKRSDVMPEVPTLTEAGVAGYEATIWLGLMAPTGTPKAVVDKLNEAVSKIASQADVKATWTKQGAAPMVMNPTVFDKYMRDDITKWAGVIKKANIKLD